MRITIALCITGRIVGEVSAPKAFFYSEAYDTWRNMVFAECLSEITSRVKNGEYLHDRIEVRVSL